MKMEHWLESGQGVRIRKFPNTPEAQEQLRAELAKAAEETKEIIRQLEEAGRTTQATMRFEFNI